MENPRNKHLTYFRVENFKCFDSIELNDLGLINIITGDNNIGKSSLLEALLFDEDLVVFNEDLGMILLDKGFTPKKDEFNSPAKRNNNFKSFVNSSSQHTSLRFYFRNIEFNNTLLSQEINIYQNQLPEGISSLPNITKLYAVDNSVITSEVNYKSSTFPEIDVTPFLSDQVLYEDLVDFYENTLQRDFNLKTKFLNFLKEFVPGAINIEIKTAKDDFKEAHLIIYTEKSSFPIPLNQYGQGTVKMLKIFMAIISFSGHRLMLDEIDNGIHFSRLKDYFTRVFLLARENNTQLFITTHSAECLKSIKEALEDANISNEASEVRLYTLNKDKNQKIKAYKYNFQELELAINSNINIRGGE